MPPEKIGTLIVGGGQAGLAMSEQLSKRGLSHLVLERHRIAERWRTERWDGLHANGPAWHDRLPGLPIAGVDPDGFATRNQMVDYFVAYAERIEAPIRCGIAVTALQRRPAGPAFAPKLPRARSKPPMWSPPPDRFNARSSRPPCRRRPGSCRCIPMDTAIPASCRRARCWWSGPVLRVLRSPTNFRGRAGASICPSATMSGLPGDIAGATSAGGWVSSAGGTRHLAIRRMKHVTIAVSGAYGGRTIDFRRLAAEGVTLVGRAEGFRRWRDALLTRPREQPRAGRCVLPVLSRRGRRLCCAERPRPARGAGGSNPRTGAGLRHRPHPAAQPPRGRHCRHRLGNGIRDSISAG